MAASTTATTTKRANRQFSTASIRVFADNINTHLDSSAVDSVLNTLANIDRQIHDDFNTVRDDLQKARQENTALTHQVAEKHRRVKRLEKENATHVSSVETLTSQLVSLRAAAAAASAAASTANATIPQAGKPARNILSTTLHPSKCNCRPSGSDRPRFFAADHAGTCALRKALLTDTSTTAMCDVLTAREDAYRNQQVLIDRLKEDNRQLNCTYSDLWSRYQQLYDARGTGAQPGERIEHLSARVQQAGQIARAVVSNVEERLKMSAHDVSHFRTSLSAVASAASSSSSESASASEIRSPTLSLRALPATPGPGSMVVQGSMGSIRDAMTDEYDNDATVSDFDFRYREKVPSRKSGLSNELIRQMAVQQGAHEKLRTTVLELTAELGRIDPDLMANVAKYRQQAEDAEGKLLGVMKKVKSKNNEILDLRRQLTKVIAEYEAISVAHSYSNAELSKIRATTREKNKHERQVNDGRLYGRAHTVMDNIDNRHHRKLHFR